MFIEPECSNCAWSFLLWSLIPSKAGLANTPTVGYLGRVLGAITPKNPNPNTQKHKHKDEDWWLFPGFVSVGGRMIYNQKSEYKYPPPKKNKHKKHNRINPKTRIGGLVRKKK